ncbi:hypothetical protein [Devosia nitrariae]|uniref:Uncharacterized protein n=1 Tax=Devosia nitrariae TaxID=2071872 RepID=A0ABQ5W0Q6_9HYPH|nr:hypothetical protein [Devosia nitrariae]GLQ53593.1 hypothetical protein GCM10010862_08520 [Devosia nitrariae]
MKAFLAYVESDAVLFDWQLHTDIDNDGFGWSLSHEEGEVATLAIEREQSGWAIMSPGHPRHGILSVSETGEPQDAVVIFRGRMVGVPSDFFGLTQRIEFEGAPANLREIGGVEAGTVDGALITYCRQHLASAPETCHLLEDTDPNDPTSYLLARSAVFHVDPVTHEVSISDLIHGDRVVGLADHHFHDLEEQPSAMLLEGETPVSAARCTFKVDWTQEAKGICDIASYFQDFASMTPDLLENAGGEFPAGLIGDAPGWTLGKSLVTTTDVHWMYGPFLSGRIFEVTYAGNDPETGYFETIDNHREMVQLGCWGYRFETVQLEYSYSQARVEEVHVVVGMDIQDVPATTRELDLGEIGVGDIFSDPGSVPYAPGPYSAGDRVRLGGVVYECTEDHVSTSFDQKPEGFQQVFLGPTPPGYSWHPYWNWVPSRAPMRVSQSSFADTDAGRQVIAHLVGRCRKQLLLRSRSLVISARYLWADAKEVTLRDSVRMSVPWHDGTSREIVGKVVALEKSWDGEIGAVITVTIAVAMGTDADGSTNADALGGYAVDDYFGGDYTVQAGAVSGIAGDTEYLIESDAVPRPIVVEQLQYASYAVESLQIKNPAGVQRGEATYAAMLGRDPRLAVQRVPTKIDLKLRDLTAEELLSRHVYVAGQVLKSPKGIDLGGSE